ncbi:MAG TPA: MFS transporter [Anaerolineae bacterium]|nr:MFS transporter [Anaerolineae bacterium]
MFSHPAFKSHISTSRVLIPLGIGIALSLLGDSTLYTVLPKPEIATQAGVTLAMVGILLGINRIVRLGFNVVAGILYDRFPRRWLMIGSLSIGTISTVLYATSTGFWTLLLGRVLWGAAWSGLWIGGTTIVLDVADEQNRGRLSGQFQMWFFLGVGLSAFLGGLFTDAFGFRDGLWLSALLNGIAVLMWIFFMPETRTRRGADSKRTYPIFDKSFPWRTTIFAAIPALAIRFVYAGVMASTTILWLTSLVGEQLLLSKVAIPIATLTGSFVALRATISMIGGPLAGFFSDTFGQRWLVIAWIITFGAVGMWFMGGSVISIALLGALIASTSGGGVQALIPAIIGDKIDQTQHGRSLGAIYAVGDIGSALGPPLALWLMGLLSINTVYRLSACLLFIAACFALWRAVSEKKCEMTR